MTSDLATSPLIDPNAWYERSLDAVRRVANMSDEARALKAAATDAVNDGRSAARQAFKMAQRRMRDATDLVDDVGYRIKRNPFEAVGIALGTGVAVGIALGALGTWAARARCASQTA